MLQSVSKYHACTVQDFFALKVHSFVYVIPNWNMQMKYGVLLYIGILKNLNLNVSEA